MIKTTTNYLELWAPGVLRIGMAVVILWFSLQQFLHNSVWVAYIPDSVVAISHLSASNLVFLNAVFELVFGLALMFGFFTRFSALLLSLHLFDIMWVVGYGEIGVRDLGLAIGTFVVFMNGSDVFCLRQREDDTQTNASFAPIQQNIQTSTYTQSITSSSIPSQNQPTPSQSSGYASQGIRKV